MADTVMAKTGALLRLTRDLVRRNIVTLGIAILSLSVGCAALDFYVDPRTSLWLGNMAAFVAGGVINFQALRCLYPDVPMQPRLIRLFGLSLLSGLAILSGAVLLILPGLYLYLRWFTIWPVLVHRDVGIIDALRSGWREMRGWELPVLLVAAGLLVPSFVLVVALIFAGVDTETPDSIGIAFLANFLAFLPMTLAYIASVACHALINGSTIDRNEA